MHNTNNTKGFKMRVYEFLISNVVRASHTEQLLLNTTKPLLTFWLLFTLLLLLFGLIDDTHYIRLVEYLFYGKEVIILIN